MGEADVSAMLGKVVLLQGTYVGPGKFGAEFVTSEGVSLVLYDGDPSPFSFPGGTAMSVGGLLSYQPAVNPCEGTPEAQECPYTGIPAYLYIRKARIRALDRSSGN